MIEIDLLEKAMLILIGMTAGGMILLLFEMIKFYRSIV